MKQRGADFIQGVAGELCCLEILKIPLDAVTNYGYADIKILSSETNDEGGLTLRDLDSSSASQNSLCAM